MFARKALLASLTENSFNRFMCSYVLEKIAQGYFIMVFFMQDYNLIYHAEMLYMYCIKKKCLSFLMKPTKY